MTVLRTSTEKASAGPKWRGDLGARLRGHDASWTRTPRRERHPCSEAAPRQTAAGTQCPEQHRFAINGAPPGGAEGTMRRRSASGHAHGSRAFVAAPTARQLPGMAGVAVALTSLASVMAGPSGPGHPVSRAAARYGPHLRPSERQCPAPRKVSATFPLRSRKPSPAPRAEARLSGTLPRNRFHHTVPQRRARPGSARRGCEASGRLAGHAANAFSLAAASPARGLERRGRASGLRPATSDLNSGKGRKDALPDRVRAFPGACLFVHRPGGPRTATSRHPGPAWRSAGLAANRAKRSDCRPRLLS
jgi:hypothetical protein